MDKFINTVTGAYPFYYHDIVKLYPNVSFPINDFVPPSIFKPIKIVPHPVTTSAQTLKEGAPMLINGVWTQQWIITP